MSNYFDHLLPSRRVDRFHCLVRRHQPSSGERCGSRKSGNRFRQRRNNNSEHHVISGTETTVIALRCRTTLALDVSVLEQTSMRRMRKRSWERGNTPTGMGAGGPPPLYWRLWGKQQFLRRQLRAQGRADEWQSRRCHSFIMVCCLEVWRTDGRAAGDGAVRLTLVVVEECCMDGPPSSTDSAEARVESCRVVSSPRMPEVTSCNCGEVSAAAWPDILPAHICLRTPKKTTTTYLPPDRVWSYRIRALGTGWDYYD